ncbi:hypothetical protein [Paraburkholderia sediminicola]|uniref:hypothetical protein n=1 Tax=Paraburkholderia sediminicola TaxID=458836 RepID=UPI0038BAFC77
MEINQKAYNVAYNWHCTRVLDGPNFGPGGLLKARWEISPPSNLLIRDIGNGAIFIVAPPSYCGDDSDQTTIPNSRDEFPTIMVADSADSPTLIQRFVREKPVGLGYSVRIKAGRISQLSSAVPDYEPSIEEKKVLRQLLASTSTYQSVWARILPEPIWARSLALSTYFEHATGIQVAPSPTRIRTNIVGQDGRNNFFPVDQKGIFPPQGFDYASYTVPLSKVGDEWVLPLRREADQALTYVLGSPTSHPDGGDCARINPSPMAQVNYDDTRVLVAASQQIFDSRRKLLIQLINSCRSLRSILTIDSRR